MFIFLFYQLLTTYTFHSIPLVPPTPLLLLPFSSSLATIHHGRRRTTAPPPCPTLPQDDGPTLTGREAPAQGTRPAAAAAVSSQRRPSTSQRPSPSPLHLHRHRAALDRHHRPHPLASLSAPPPEVQSGERRHVPAQHLLPALHIRLHAVHGGD